MESQSISFIQKNLKLKFEKMSDFLIFIITLAILLPITSWVRLIFHHEKPIIVYAANIAIGLLSGSVSYNFIANHSIGMLIPFLVIYWSYRAREMYDSRMHLYLPPVLFAIAFSLFYFQYSNVVDVIQY